MNALLNWRAEIQRGQNFDWVSGISFREETRGARIRRIDLMRDDVVARVNETGTMMWNDGTSTISRTDGRTDWTLTYMIHGQEYPTIGRKGLVGQLIGFKIEDDCAGLYLCLATLNIEFRAFGPRPSLWRMQRA
ncbi:MAG: hypothetical protein KIS92_02735 [Planctomycetota bacterium]|nr:hypothetical protein [Planctomycetota bacterium]